ncbi:MAG TPA: L,D-transpeptidase family protein [Candidatus Paceibacterota bacterium]
MLEKTGRSMRLLSFRDDQPNELKGLLIPRSVQAKQQQKKPSMTRSLMVVGRVALPVAAFAVFAFVGITGYGLVASNGQVATPSVTIMDPETLDKVLLPYGQHSALAQKTFFTEAINAFIEEGQTFIEIDLDAKFLRYFKDGVLTYSMEVQSLGEEGSWWDAPSGLYQVDKKDDYDFSTAAQAYFPWTVTFEGNYMIHGWPEYPDKTPVPENFVGGGIRVDNANAKLLYEAVEAGIPVLVHQKPTDPDQFVYEPTVPDIATPHYLIADLENGAILAASDLDDAVPIASLTKLVTAVVAAEKLDLDSRVQVTAPTFVQSLIPRLADRTSVSMYSLLQLLLVESSNEAAEVIAGEYGRDNFVTEMNAKAKQIGMLNSSFADPSGLSAGNRSSLGDLFRLSDYIYKNRKFIFDITAEGEMSTMEGMNEFESLVNFNEVEEVDNFIGGKVGETSAAGQTSVTIHNITLQGSERTVVIILLGSASRDDDVRTLIRFVEDRFKR